MTIIITIRSINYEEYNNQTEQRKTIKLAAELNDLLANYQFHSFSAYLKHSEIKEVTDVTDWKKAMEQVVKGLQVILTKKGVFSILQKMLTMKEPLR